MFVLSRTFLQVQVSTRGVAFNGDCDLLFRFGSFNQRWFLSKETTYLTVTRGTLRADKVNIIILALLSKFFYDHRENNTFVDQENTGLLSTKIKWLFWIFL